MQSAACGLGADVEALHVVGDVALDDGGEGVSVGHLAGDDVIDGELDAASGLRRSLARSTLSRSTRLRPIGTAPGEEESAGHGAADQERVALAEELLNDFDLVWTPWPCRRGWR